MNVLFITDKFIPERGGSQIIFGHVYAHLRGHQVTVLTRNWPGDAECDRDYPHRVVRVPYSSVPKLRSPLLWRSLASTAARLASEQKFDQIHCGQTVETAPAGTRLAKRLGIPSVSHTFAEDVTSYLTHPYYGRLMRQGFRDATVITTISRFTAGHLGKLGVSEDRIRLLYPGVTAENWRSTGREAEIRRRFGLEGKRVLLTVSRLIPRKGQDTVLRALPSILKRVPDCVYLIVGGGPEETRLEALATEMGLNEHVRFAGSIANTETVDFYRACDAFVMPNRMMPNGDIEGFGLVFLEANVCGKPVIGGDSGGTPDAIVHGETGFLVDPYNADDVAARAIELLTQPEMAARMGEAGQRRTVEQFTWEQSAAALEGAMELAARRRGEPAHV